jgi:predicted outer membrane protein
MKIVAVTVGISQLGMHVLGAEQQQSGGENPATTPRTPEEVREIPPVEPPVAPSTKKLATTLSGKDVEFLMTAYEHGRLLAWLGDIAANRAENAHVRMMGMTLQRTLAGENEEVRNLATKKGVKVDPSNPPVQQRKAASELPKSAGHELDKVLTLDMLAVAKKALATYEQGLKSEDKEIRALAERMLPKAKERCEHADNVARSVPATGVPAL